MAQLHIDRRHVSAAVVSARVVYTRAHRSSRALTATPMGWTVTRGRGRADADEGVALDNRRLFA